MFYSPHLRFPHNISDLFSLRNFLFRINSRMFLINIYDLP
uniref:Uncharacterized protein n=1 Tax=Lepeophtheirus salmonis TaxID=72036 RepID=A0A0K2VDS3_LEPSM